MNTYRGKSLSNKSNKLIGELITYLGQATRGKLCELFRLLRTFSLVVIQIRFANSETFWRYFKQLIIVNKLNALLQAHLFSLADFYGVRRLCRPMVS